MGASFPESEYVRKTFVLRKMDFPPQVSLTKRSLVRWFALSFGLISEKESRSTILDVLDGVFHLQISKKLSPTTLELLEHLKTEQRKIDEKLLRYHVKRLIDVGLLERRKGKLSFVIDPTADRNDIVRGFHFNIGKPVQESLESISSALGQIKEKYEK
ncbi:MAG TPA: hypothetical protein VJG83_06905 [archaeon]|nr:hypothetical protein [archaeon]